MEHGPPVPLTPVPVKLDSDGFRAISGWPFSDPFVERLLQNDIPERVKYGNCSIWIYRNPDRSLVGFDTLDVCGECGEFTGEKLHPYIPLLAINPTIKSHGYGTSIVRHLIDVATLFALRGICHDVLFLDVYTNNEKAIRVYTDCGFVTVSPTAIPDPDEGGQTYVVMAKRVSLASP